MTGEREPRGLEFTGERLLPDACRHTLDDLLMSLLHGATYEYACGHCEGRRVLDLGCGEGYGASRLAQVAAHVVAVDVAQQAVGAARAKYRETNLSFGVITATAGARLPFADEAFDVVTSYHVIEHVADVDGYLHEVRRVLSPGGTFLLSTPNARLRLLPLQRPWNRFHVKELSARQLLKVVAGHFPSVQLLGVDLTQPWKARELRRLTRRKWLLWPFSNAVLPARVRCILLEALWRATRDRSPGVTAARLPVALPERSAAVISSQNPDSCLYLLLVAKRSGRR